MAKIETTSQTRWKDIDVHVQNNIVRAVIDAGYGQTSQTRWKDIDVHVQNNIVRAVIDAGYGQTSMALIGIIASAALEATGYLESKVNIIDEE